MKPILSFKDMIIINSYRFTPGVIEITFQIGGNLVNDGSGFTNTGDDLVWSIDDGGTITQFTQNNTPAYTLVNAFADVTVSSTDSFQFVTKIELDGQNIKDTLEISVLTEISGQLQIHNNSSLNYINFPVNSELITLIRVYACGLIGTLDLSNLSNMVGCTLEAYNNVNLTDITLNDNTELAGLRVENSGLVGDFNISNITSISGAIDISSNTGLTDISFPNSGGVINGLFADGCDLTGILDLSMLTNGIISHIYLYLNPNLTGISFASNTSLVNRLWAFSCGLTGTLDISGLTGGISSISLRSNGNLTSITFPTTSVNCNQLDIYNCDLTGTLDLSGMTGLGGTPHRYYGNSNLTGITLPATTRTFGIFYAYSCNLGYVDFTVMPNMMGIDNHSLRLENNSMTAAEVNHILVDLASMVGGESAGGDYTGRSIDISGTNAASDSTSGGFNGTQAVIDLQGKGFTVTTS